MKSIFRAFADKTAEAGARTSLVNLERLPDEELARLKEEFERISQSRTDRR